MLFYHHSQVPENGIRHVFKSGSWQSLFYVALIMAGITAYTAIPKGEETHQAVVAVPALATVFFLALCLRRYQQCATPRNWLLKVGQDGLYINLRSYLNAHLDEEEPTVLFVPEPEIAAIGLTHETRPVPGQQRNVNDRYSYVDIYLRHDRTGGLQAALQRERRRVGRARWLRQAKSHDYPVRVIDPPGIRLVWDWIRPHEKKALALLEEHYPIAPEQTVKHPPWEKLTGDEQEELIAELWEAGHLDDARRLVQLKHEISRRRAEAYLEENVAAKG